MKHYTLLVILMCILVLPALAQEPIIQQVEYFIDEDPGIGFATPMKITNGTTVDESYSIPLGGLNLEPGFHTIGIRAGFNTNVWGFYETRLFYIQEENDDESTPRDLASLEYFFDVDPGVGKAISLGSISQDAVIDISTIVDDSVESGWHIIGIRARNTLGKWGFAERRPVYVEDGQIIAGPAAKITQLEYFINNDPGVGNATKIQIDPAVEVVDIASLIVPTNEGIPIGTNEITIRALNDQGNWGFGEVSEFDVIDDCDQPEANFNPVLACEGEIVLFRDMSTSLQEDASYRWYLNGDDQVDATNKGDVSFTYQNSGTYTVALAISQGQICYDSVYMDIIIKAKPIVVFNTDPVAVGTSTNFEVTQFNVDPTAIWSWDFNADEQIDDNTPGSVSFTYPQVGTYQAKLTVSDNAGCNTSFSRAVTVNQPGGGDDGPSALFRADATCLGSTTEFIDQSANIPEGATYSWDFDGDGDLDDDTPGNTSFTYSQSGEMMVALTISLPDESTIMHTIIVQVNPLPEALFEVNAVCLGDEAVFINTSVGTGSSTVFSWDYNGDGISDSQSAEGGSFTYTEPGEYAAVLTIDNGSCYDVAVKTVNVFPMPIADFMFASSCIDEPVYFDDLSINTTSGSNYTWDFDGDGEVDSEQQGDVSFTYSNTASYNVTLFIDNGSGCTSSITKEISLGTSSSPTFSTNEVCFGESTMFTDMSDVAEGDTYSWDFNGDGVIDSETRGSTTYSYMEAGEYNAILTINLNSCPSRMSKTVTVNSLPQIELSDKANFCDGETVTLSAGDGFAKYEWSDGSTASTLEVGIADTYAVKVTTDQGCIAHAEIVVESQEEAKAAFVKTVESRELTAVVTFENTSKSADRYVWDFGDGSTSVEANPVHEYTDINLFFGSTYEVCLTAFNGCDSEQYCDIIGLIVTAKEDDLSNELVVFPNPASSTITIKWHKSTKTTKIRLVDISGSQIWLKDFSQASSIDQYQFDVSGLKPGQYIFEVISTKSVHRKKLIIE